MRWRGLGRTRGNLTRKDVGDTEQGWLLGGLLDPTKSKCDTVQKLRFKRREPSIHNPLSCIFGFGSSSTPKSELWHLLSAALCTLLSSSLFCSGRKADTPFFRKLLAVPPLPLKQSYWQAHPPATNCCKIKYKPTPDGSHGRIALQGNMRGGKG